MRYWIFWIEDVSGDFASLGQGWVRAPTMEDVRDMIAHPDLVFTEVPDDRGFPAAAAGEIFWDHKAPILNH